MPRFGARIGGLTWDQPRQIVGGPQADGLVAAWPLAEGGGAAAFDLTGAHSAVVVGAPGAMPGPHGSASLFGGSDYLTTTLAWTAAQALTLSAWVYSTEATATYRNVFDAPATNAGPMIWFNPSGQIEFDGGVSAVTTSIAYRGRWVHVALSKPAGNATPSYYVDGRLFATGPSYNAAAGGVGILNRGGTSPWLGGAQDLRIYARALSAVEIADIHAYPLRLVGSSRRLTTPAAAMGLVLAATSGGSGRAMVQPLAAASPNASAVAFGRASATAVAVASFGSFARGAGHTVTTIFPSSDIAFAACLRGAGISAAAAIAYPSAIRSGRHVSILASRRAAALAAPLRDLAVPGSRRSASVPDE